MNEVLYLYGVGFAPLHPPDAPGGVGPGSGAFGIVTCTTLSALVATVDAPRPAATSRNLAAHERVVDAVALRQTFLPARFGIVVADASVLRAELLTGRRTASLRRALEWIDGSVELRLTIRHDTDELLRHAVAHSPAMDRLRRRTAGRPAAATYYERIALGEAAREEVVRLQHQDLELLQGSIRSSTRAVRLLAAPDGTVTRLACLVARQALDRFDAALERFTRSHQRRVEIDVVGPLATWDFSDVPDAPPEGGRRNPSRQSLAGTVRG